MRAFLILIFLSFYTFSAAQKIVWTENRKLTWSDFKSSISNQKDKDIVAYTNCGIKYTVLKTKTGNLKIIVQAIFDSDKSWKNSELINMKILNHEQRHFDIAEIFARKIKQETLKKIKTKQDFDIYFNGIYKRIYAEYLEFQKEYDEATKRGVNSDKQKVYDLKINQLLGSLKAYKN